MPLESWWKAYEWKEYKKDAQRTFLADKIESINYFNQNHPSQNIENLTTIGGATPREVFQKINTLRKAVEYNIKTYFYNDIGYTIVNAYNALEAEATYINTIVLGIGERNSITSLSGLVISLISTGRKYSLN